MDTAVKSWVDIERKIYMTILDNLALIDLNNFCKDNGIDISGTYLLKVPRKYTWNLVRAKDAKHAYIYGSSTLLASVTFSKSSVPTHIIY